MKPRMPTATDRPSWRRVRLLRGLYRLGHPLPTFATAAAVVLFVATARNGRAPLVDLFVAFLVFYLLLYSIGAMNDYCDEAVDRASGSSRKAARGRRCAAPGGARRLDRRRGALSGGGALFQFWRSGDDRSPLALRASL